jgi:S-(hydroxymethyl)glutathione dehydrogenase / alcohol dehydrogenase
LATKNNNIAISFSYAGSSSSWSLSVISAASSRRFSVGCPAKKYNEQLLHLIETGRIDATKILSHTKKLDDAPKAYEMFDRKEDVTKIIFKP